MNPEDKSLSDEEIVTVAKVSRRSWLTLTGLRVAAGAIAVGIAAGTLGSKTAAARDRKNADSDRRDSGNDRD
jgi:hypothetical protein